ncbi:hypothetical protein [Bacillus cereus]|nr:hypothetical protein [Bacillus cereus]PGM91520.1 hypothetical protein CN958_18130 [Bacillus cereus]
MFKRYSMFIICETLFTSLIGCTTNNSDTTTKNKIPLPDGNIGRVLQTSNGYVIIFGNEKVIFDVLVFKK